MVLDHIYYICVRPGAPEAEALKDFELIEGSPNRHQGQGTANRRFFFQNAFLELLWLEDFGEAQSDVTRPTMLYERLRSQGQAVSPFGIGFRPAISNEKQVPFPSWSYKPLYLPADLTVEIGEGAPLSEPCGSFCRLEPGLILLLRSGGSRWYTKPAIGRSRRFGFHFQRVNHFLRLLSVQ